MSEVRRVLLANGQYIEIVQETGTSTGSVMSQSAVTAALNAKANTTHNHTASNITGGTFSSARIADGAITTAKLANGSVTKAKLGTDISLPSSYEVVTVTASVTNATSRKGAKVSIGGIVYIFDSDGVVYAQIPYGQVYSVTPITDDLMIGGSKQTFTASTANRSVSVTYSINNGTFIQDKAGILYTYDSWNPANNSNANAIAVISDTHSFLISLARQDSKTIYHSEYNGNLSVLGTCYGTNEAITKYNGASATETMVGIISSTNYAAGWCNAYTFPDGVTKGYLPAAGELYIALQNRGIINRCLTKCGGVEIPTSLWSSTLSYSSYDEYKTYFWCTNTDILTIENLNTLYSVRAFGAL